MPDQRIIMLRRVLLEELDSNDELRKLYLTDMKFYNTINVAISTGNFKDALIVLLKYIGELHAWPM